VPRQARGDERPLDLRLEQIAYCLYQVRGLPPGNEALIAGADYRGWHVLRTFGAEQDEDWTGHYGTVEEALLALEAYFDADPVVGFGPRAR